MARNASIQNYTVKKAEFAAKLVEKKPDITQRDLGAKVFEKFGTGLNFQDQHARQAESRKQMRKRPR